MAARVRARTSGCRMASSCCFEAASRNTSSRIRPRSRPPSGPITSGPKRSRIAGIASPPGAVSAREISSVSTTAAPSASNRPDTTDFPEPMPPVSPTQYGMLEEVEVVPVDPLAPEHRDQPRNREVGTERDRLFARMLREQDQRDPHHRANQGRGENRERQHLPAEPGADRGEQLEVPVAHALLAGHELERPEHGPQREVARRGADHRRVQVGENAAGIDQQPRPQQRQRDAVGQVIGVEIDEGERDHRPREEASAKRGGGEPIAPHDVSGERRGERLDDGIAQRNRGAAVGAFPAQEDVARDRDVLDRADHVAALRARGARLDEVVALAGRRGRAGELRALGAPLPLEHLRQAVNDDDEEAADDQAGEHRDGDEKRGIRVERSGQTAWPILKIGRYMAMTMPPMSVPSTTMIMGSIRLDSASTASSTSDSKKSATLDSMASSEPASSPIATI